MEQHRDIFTPAQAAAYLGLSSEEALKALKSKGMLKGYSGWARYDLYHREDLDECARRMFGRDQAGKGQQLKLAGGQ